MHKIPQSPYPHLSRPLRSLAWVAMFCLLVQSVAAAEQKAADTDKPKPLNYIFIKRAFTTQRDVRHGIEFTMQGEHDGTRVGELVSTTFTQNTLDLIHATIAADKAGKPLPTTAPADTQFAITKTTAGTWNLRPSNPAARVPTRNITIINGANIALRQLPEMFTERADTVITLSLGAAPAKQSGLDTKVTLLPGEYSLVDVLNLFIEQHEFNNWIVRHHCDTSEAQKDSADSSDLTGLRYRINLYVE